MKGRHAAGLGVLCALALAGAVSLQASDSPLVAIGFEAQAKRFVTGTVTTASQLAAKTAGKPDTATSERVSALLARRVETHELARFVLGSYGRRASEAERTRFEKALPNYLARLLAGELGAFANRTLTINEVVETGSGDGDVLVLSRIAGKGRLPLRVDWRVRPTKAGPKLVDVIVEGLSLAVAQRREFLDRLRRNGGKLDKLIARLEARPAHANAEKAFGAKTNHTLAGATSAN